LRRGADHRAKRGRFGRYPAIAAALVFAACGALLLARNSGDGEGGTLARNPFELGPLLLFALFFAFVATASADLANWQTAPKPFHSKGRDLADRTQVKLIELTADL
jgi:hypothetical protein